MQNVNMKMRKADRHGRQRRSNMYINDGLEDENRMAHKLILKNKVKQILVK